MTTYCLQQALLHPHEWKATTFQRWFQGELEEAERQRNGTSTGLMYNIAGGRELGDFREAQARKFQDMEAAEISQYLAEHRCCIYDTLAAGFPVSALSVEAYNSINIPKGYTRVGDYLENTMSNENTQMETAAAAVKAVVKRKWPLMDLVVTLETKGPNLKVRIEDRGKKITTTFEAPTIDIVSGKDPQMWILNRIHAVINLPAYHNA